VCDTALLLLACEFQNYERRKFTIRRRARGAAKSAQPKASLAGGQWTSGCCVVVRGDDGDKLFILILCI
jgi:hypothetical protein